MSLLVILANPPCKSNGFRSAQEMFSLRDKPNQDGDSAAAPWKLAVQMRQLHEHIDVPS